MADEIKAPLEGETDQTDLGIKAESDNDKVEDTSTDDSGDGAKTDDKSGTVSKEDLDKIQKELDQIKMERNQLRKKTKAQETKLLESTEDYKSAYEELKTKVDDQEAKDEAANARKEAEAFRERVISEYPETVQKAAKKLIEKNPSNLIWDSATDWNDARAQLTPQLDALQEALGVKNDEPEDKTVIHSNNPRPKGEKAFEDLTLEEMRKQLPRADSR